MKEHSRWQNWLQTRIEGAVRFITKHSEIDENALFSARAWTALSDAVFKLAEWITLIGLFRYLSEITGSIYASAAYYLLNGALLVSLVTWATVIKIRVVEETKPWQRLYNKFVNVCIFLIIYSLLSLVANRIVEEVVKLN